LYAFWAFLAATFAVTAEVLYKKGFAWGDYWWLFVPMAVVINYAVFRTVMGGPTLLLSIVAFSLSTLVLRSLASQFLLGEPLAKGNLVALCALGAAVVAGHLWK
jgi:hypothetical protein